VLDGQRVIDADGHINDWHLDWGALAPGVAPEDLPRSIRDDRGFRRLEVDGRVLPEPPDDATAELDFTDWQQVQERRIRDDRFWTPRPGEEDPHLRLPDMDEMGIDVAVLFGGHCFLVEAMVERAAVAVPTLHAYNTYLAGYCAVAPDRLKGVAMLAIQDPSAAADELRRTVGEYGFVAGVLPPHHADGTKLSDERLEPIWRAATELGVPLCVHTIGIQINPVRKLIEHHNLGEAYGGIPSMLALGHLIFDGVLDRHPALRVAFLETGVGWVPYVVERLESSYEHFTLKGRELDRSPEEHLSAGNLYFAAEPDERLLPAVADLVGRDQLVLGSDYCHPEGMCPFTMRVLAERDDLDEDLKRRILWDNPARLYGLSL